MKTVRRIALVLALPAVLAGLSLAATGHPGNYNERFVIRATDQIHAVQMTYGATVGNGNFGSLAELHAADLIDAALASGNKYGYSFVMSVTPGAPAGFVLTATPHRYPKTGRRSFFIDTSGEMHGGDKNGGVATASDPYIDSCALWGAADNERCAIRALRTLHGAESTYQATYGTGNFGTLFQLGEAALINRILATGLIHGYGFNVTFVGSTPDLPASFKIYATPRTYRTTGIRSFFIDTSGVLRGADKGGAPADENDPPINQ
jgi:hypothetical protein